MKRRRETETSKSVRVLRVARASACKGRTQALNQMRNLDSSAPSPSAPSSGDSASSISSSVPRPIDQAPSATSSRSPSSYFGFCRLPQAAYRIHTANDNDGGVSMRLLWTGRYTPHLVVTPTPSTPTGPQRTSSGSLNEMGSGSKLLTPEFGMK